MKKVISCLAVLVSLISLSSCKKQNASVENSPVVIWHWMTDRDEAFQELSKRYKQETGRDVQFQLYAPSDLYSQKVRVGAQTNSLPDVYGILGDSRDLASFVEAGHVENLTAQLGDGPGSWKNSFYAEAVNTAYFKPVNQFQIPEGYYGIPIDVTTLPMIYNKALFRKAGLDPEKPPKTWDDFIETGKKLKKSGVTGFVSGWAETWLIYSLVTDLAFNVMGEEKLINTFAGKVPYTDPDWIEVLGAFEKLQKAGFADPSLVTLGNKSAEQAFSFERSAITFNGSWAVNVYAGMNPKLEYAPFYPPALNPKNPSRVWFLAGSVFYVNAKSPNKSAAVEFLKWFTSKEASSYLLTTTKNLPASKEVGDDVPAFLKQFSNLIENSFNPNGMAVTEDPKVQEVLNKGIQSILIGEKTPKQVAAEIQKAKEKASAQ
jgi:ABC-type glycerol-3-phosphate transport system substrate-binding protein